MESRSGSSFFVASTVDSAERSAGWSRARHASRDRKQRVFLMVGLRSGSPVSDEVLRMGTLRVKLRTGFHAFYLEWQEGLQHAIATYLKYYHRERNHQGLAGRLRPSRPLNGRTCCEQASFSNGQKSCTEQNDHSQSGIGHRALVNLAS